MLHENYMPFDLGHSVHTDMFIFTCIYTYIHTHTLTYRELASHPYVGWMQAAEEHDCLRFSVCSAVSGSITPLESVINTLDRFVPK